MVFLYILSSFGLHFSFSCFFFFFKFILSKALLFGFMLILLVHLHSAESTLGLPVLKWTAAFWVVPPISRAQPGDPSLVTRHINITIRHRFTYTLKRRLTVSIGFIRVGFELHWNAGLPRSFVILCNLANGRLAATSLAVTSWKQTSSCRKISNCSCQLIRQCCYRDLVNLTVMYWLERRKWTAEKKKNKFPKWCQRRH